MPKDILIREIPDAVSDWVETERKAKRLSQQEFILTMLDTARKNQLSIFKSKRLIPKPEGKSDFRFIDLFAGVGGFRIALERLGGDCVFTSEWDKYSQKTYAAWFGECPEGDLRQIKPEDIPDHDILAAGFPCQPFSIAGVSKKKSLGRAHGFKDEKQGNLFFVLADIIRVKRPSILFLENVKNLYSHDGGKTWRIIKGTLEDLGYCVREKIIDAAHWVPQHRERIFIIGFDKKIFGDNPSFDFPDFPKTKPKLKTLLEKKPDNKYTLTKHLWRYLQNYAKRHKEKGNGFGFGFGDPNGITRTLSARYHKDGSEILIDQGSELPPRRLTPKECAKLMGFPEEGDIVVSDTQAYRQFGNAVVVPVVYAVGSALVATMRKNKRIDAGRR